MAKKRTQHSGEAVNIPRNLYDAMVDTMLELAFRGAQQEAIIMRAAKAGGIHEVTKEITRRRMYAKKQGMVRAGRDDAEDRPKPVRQPKRKRKAPQPPPQPPTEGAKHDPEGNEA